MDNKIKILSIDYDNVIESRYITAKTNYEFSIAHLIPLIDRLDIQRNVQSNKFYRRLENDLIKGCIMPPITLAFIDTSVMKQNVEIELETYVNDNVSNGFILDGIQRLNTLERTVKNHADDLDLKRVLFLNIIICSSMDNLLYRMVTLNNGQKPMSARHQIEILTSNLFDFQETGERILTEKDSKNLKISVSFNRADFIKGYLAFLSNSTNIENQKIIEDQMDALIADKILENSPEKNDIEYYDVIRLIDSLASNSENYKWFKNANNLIGFSVGIKKSYSEVFRLSIEEFENYIKNFEKAFSSFDYSKIKIGKMRRNLVEYFISNLDSLKDKEELELVDKLSQVD
jgi:hypothetical protein